MGVGGDVRGWSRRLLVICALLLAVMVHAQGLYDAQAAFSDEASAALYNVELQLTAPADAVHGTQVALEWQSAKDAVVLSLTRTALSVSAVKDGKSALIGKDVLSIKPNTQYRLALLRRDDWLGVLLDDKLIFGKTVPRAPGNQVSLLAGTGWTVTSKSVQALDPVAFADDFMRTDNSYWKAGSGIWDLQSTWVHDVRVQIRHQANSDTA